MRKMFCTTAQLIESLEISNNEEIVFFLEDEVSLSDLQKIANSAKQNYKTFSEEDLLKGNVLNHLLDLSNTKCLNINRKDLFQVLCILPFKIIKLSTEMANILSVDWKQFADPVYGGLISSQITDLFDPLLFADKNFHNCGSYAYIKGLHKEDFWNWCGEPHLRYNANQLDDKDPTDLLLLEIEHWKKFRTLFEGIPELHFTYFLNHWNTNIIDEFFEDYPDLYNLPNNVIDNIHQKQNAFQSKIRHINTFELQCKKSDLKFFVLDNKGSKDSIFHLKITGNIGVGSISSGYGEIYKWLCKQKFNGCFGLDLRETYGLTDIRGENFTSEVPEYPLYSVRLKYLYLPKETRSIYWHSFINQPSFSELLFSSEKFSFYENSLSETAINSFRFPSEYYMSPEALPWEILKEITLPDTFAINPLFHNKIIKNSKYNQWEFLFSKCKNLTRINVPQGMDGFLLTIQKNYLEEMKKKISDIQIEKIV